MYSRFVEKYHGKLAPIGAGALVTVESAILRVNSNRQAFQEKMKQISESLKEFVEILGKI